VAGRFRDVEHARRHGAYEIGIAVACRTGFIGAVEA
jgi:hypothetical protein